MKGPPKAKGKMMTGKHSKMPAGPSQMGGMDSELARGLRAARPSKSARVSRKLMERID